MKAQGRALSAYLVLQEGFHLHHARCLDAVAAMHGYHDWNDIMAHERMSSNGLVPDDAPNQSMAEQASCLSKHLVNRYGFHVAEAHEAIAAVRWGALVRR